MQTLRIERNIVHADWQWPSMRKRAPEALYCCTTASNRGICPGRAPIHIPSADTEPSAQAGPVHAPRAQRNISALNANFACCALRIVPRTKWRALRDSNPCYRRERAMSWTARRRARIKREQRICKWRRTYKGLRRDRQASPAKPDWRYGPSPLPGIGHRGPGFLRRERRALLQKLDRMFVGRAHEGHVAVARRPVDGDAPVHQFLAKRIDVVDFIG